MSDYYESICKLYEKTMQRLEAEDCQDEDRQFLKGEAHAYFTAMQLSEFHSTPDEPPAPELTEPELADTPVVFVKSVDGSFWCEGCKQNINGYKQECVTVDGDKQLCLGCYTLQTLNKSGAFISPVLTDEQAILLEWIASCDSSEGLPKDKVLLPKNRDAIETFVELGYVESTFGKWHITKAGRAALKAHTASVEGKTA